MSKRAEPCLKQPSAFRKSKHFDPSFSRKRRLKIKLHSPGQACLFLSIIRIPSWKLCAGNGSISPRKQDRRILHGGAFPRKPAISRFFFSPTPGLASRGPRNHSAARNKSDHTHRFNEPNTLI